jgi:hypothetical protein
MPSKKHIIISDDEHNSSNNSIEMPSAVIDNKLQNT